MASEEGRVSGVQFGAVNAFCISNNCRYFVTGDTDANEDNIDVLCDILLVPCGGKSTLAHAIAKRLLCHDQQKKCRK